ncbi:MAG: hypothetical protein OEV28_09255 [Nitrospirota bacterium]|nr:hypothetical protein [Nitrospirota bacterium]
MRPTRVHYLLLMLLALSLLSAGCFKKPPPPSPDAIKVSNARAEMNALVNSYENRNLTAFINHFPFEYRGRQDAADLAEKDFAAYTKIDLTMYVDRVTLVKDEVTLYTHWEGFWTDKSGKKTRDLGTLILVYTGDSKLKLTQLEGSNFFGKAVRRK